MTLEGEPSCSSCLIAGYVEKPDHEQIIISNPHQYHLWCIALLPVFIVAFITVKLFGVLN